MTLIEAAFFLPCFLVAILFLWLLAYMPQNLRRDRAKQPGALDRMDELRWSAWSFPEGWPPLTCWSECRDLHREDWWRAYLHQTCWSGCRDLHREDWWRAYLEQAGPEQAGPRVTEAPVHSRPISTQRPWGTPDSSARGAGLPA